MTDLNELAARVEAAGIEADTKRAYLQGYHDGNSDGHDDMQHSRPIEAWELRRKYLLSPTAAPSVDALVEALTKVRDTLRDSDEWWMTCPDRGGFDLEAIENALEAHRAAKETPSG